MSHESRSTVGVSASQVHGIGVARRYDGSTNTNGPERGVGTSGRGLADDWSID